jgi:hypothetical protein
MANFLVIGITRAIACPRRVIVTSPSAMSRRSRCDKDWRASRMVSFFISSSPANDKNGFLRRPRGYHVLHFMQL